MILNVNGGLIMLNEAGLTIIAAIGVIGTQAILFRFLNAKINKVEESKGKKIEKLNGEKQDKEMCNERFNHLSNSLSRVEKKLDMVVVVAKDDLRRVVTKLDHGTEVQNTIQQSIVSLVENIKSIYARDEARAKD